MSVIIKKKTPPTTKPKRVRKPKPAPLPIVKKKVIKKAVHKQTPIDTIKNPLVIKAALEKYHSKTDEELETFIEPIPERVSNANHRLDTEQQEARLVLLHRMLI